MEGALPTPLCRIPGPTGALKLYWLVLSFSSELVRFLMALGCGGLVALMVLVFVWGWPVWMVS